MECKMTKNLANFSLVGSVIVKTPAMCTFVVEHGMLDNDANIVILLDLIQSISRNYVVKSKGKVISLYKYDNNSSGNPNN